MRVFKKNVLLRNQTWKNNDKRRRRKRSRDNRSVQQVTDHVPLDLTLEILSRLPAKSILRYRCVSKLWSSLTRLPSFINSFTSQSSSRSQSLLFVFLSDERKFVFSFRQHQNSPDGSTTYSPFYTYEITDTDWGSRRSGSVQGLILLDGFKIWNPTLRRVLALPHPNEHIPTSQNYWESYLGYDPLEGKHKVLCVSFKEQPRILTLGAQESWRIITKGCPMHRPNGPHGPHGECFNGVLYYFASVDDNQPIIMSFDVNSENFNLIKLPESILPLRLYLRSRMIPFEGRLALGITYFPIRVSVNLYILRDADGNEWTHQFFHAPIKREWMEAVYFTGITDAGELIFTPFTFSKSFYFLYFDPRRNRSREIYFYSNMGEFRHRYALVSDCKFIQGVYPNHVESLVSW